MSFETTKIFAALLVAMILSMVTGILAHQLVEPKMLEKGKYAYPITVTQPAAKAETAAAPAGPEPIEPLLASASVDAGKDDTKKCATCHTFEKGDPNRIGPNLYGILGDHVGEGRGGFSFSDGLSKMGGDWTVDKLNDWLFNPKHMVPNTKMIFPGLPKAKERADVIAYLNSLSDSPKPLPTEAPKSAEPAKAAEPAKPAEPAK